MVTGANLPPRAAAAGLGLQQHSSRDPPAQCRRLHALLFQLSPRVDTLGHALPPAGTPTTQCVAAAGLGGGASFAEGWPAALPPPVYKRVPRYAVGDRAVLGHLEEHGYAVVADVLTAAEVTSSIAKLWDFMEGMGTGIDRSDISTWNNQHWMENSAPGSGLMSGHGLGHSEALWYVRGVPKLKEVWATLHGTDDLIISFDGMCQFRPWGVDPSWRTVSGWFHNDRVPGPPVTSSDSPRCGTTAGIYSRDYIQGFANLVQTSEATGGNVVVEGSHKHYAALALQYYGEGEAGGGGLNKAMEERPELFAFSVIAHLEAGDVFLWDDRYVGDGAHPEIQ